MTEPTRAPVAECLHCGIEFVPRKAGHVFHSIECRHRGERSPEERRPVDTGAVDRLFDLSRDPGERCRVDDWFSPSDAPLELRELYAVDTVATRRRWYLNLKRR